MKIGTIKADTPKVQPHEIQEVGKTPKGGIRVEITTKHKYNIISSTKRFNHMTTFKFAPKLFPIGSDNQKIIHIG